MNIAKYVYGGIVLLSGAFILGLVGLVGLQIFMAIQQQSDVYQRRAWIAYGNSAASYPIFGAVAPRVSGSKTMASDAHFLDLRNGNRTVLKLLDYRFNSITAIEGRPGNFLLTGRHADTYVIVQNDVESGKASILQSGSRELRHAFLLGELVCAFSPTARTTKQAHNFQIVCNGDVASDVKVSVIDQLISAGGRAAVLEGAYKNRRLYFIEPGSAGGRVDVYTTPVPDGIGVQENLFVFDGQMYLVSWDANGPLRLFRIAADNIEPVDGPLIDRLARIERGKKRFRYVGADRVVLVERDPKARDLAITTWHSGSDGYQTRSLDLERN